MVYKRSILKKNLSNGQQADIGLVKNEGYFQAALYIGGRLIRGPALPQELTSQKGDVTHWMGNHPSVGLTADENAKILNEVRIENSVIQHRRIS